MTTSVGSPDLWLLVRGLSRPRCTEISWRFTELLRISVSFPGRCVNRFSREAGSSIRETLAPLACNCCLPCPKKSLHHIQLSGSRLTGKDMDTCL